MQHILLSALLKKNLYHLLDASRFTVPYTSQVMNLTFITITWNSGILCSIIQWNLSNPKSWRRNRQGVKLHSVKHIENGQKGMKINLIYNIVKLFPQASDIRQVLLNISIYKLNGQYV